MYCLIPKHLGIYCFIIDFLFHLTAVRECVLYDLKPVKFTDICLVAKYFFFLVKVICALEKNVYSAVVPCSILCLSIMLSLFIFQIVLSFLISLFYQL